MKRSFNEMNVSESLPTYSIKDKRLYYSVLDGSYRLRVTKVVDISKPTDKPIEDIDEPEQDVKTESKLNKASTRMLQLDLIDNCGTVLRAVETERISALDTIDIGSQLTIVGPIDLRCSNLMLMNRHIANVELKKEDTNMPLPAESTNFRNESKPAMVVPTKPPVTMPSTSKIIETINITEDWDDDWDDSDDCILIE